MRFVLQPVSFTLRPAGSPGSLGRVDGVLPPGWGGIGNNLWVLLVTFGEGAANMAISVLKAKI